jgi:hypothetical protein
MYLAPASAQCFVCGLVAGLGAVTLTLLAVQSRNVF